MVSVLNTVDTGHEDMIHDAEMDYYGLRLATCSSDNSVKIFDLKNGSQSLVADLKGHVGPVWQVAWAHPKFGNLLASCSYDRYFIIALIFKFSMHFFLNINFFKYHYIFKRLNFNFFPLEF